MTRTRYGGSFERFEASFRVGYDPSSTTSGTNFLPELSTVHMEGSSQPNHRAGDLD